MITRRNLMLAAGLLAATASLAITGPSVAQTFPEKPLTLIVPFPAGGPTDVQARIVAKGMEEALGQQIVINNRAGAGGNVAAELAANSDPDGYTMFFATGGTHGINPNLYATVPYDPVEDFDPVVMVSRSPNVFVAHPDFPGNTIADLIEMAKKEPGVLNYASAGHGTTTHMSAELLKSMTGIDVVHVPYSGGAPAMNDLISGQIMLMADGLPSSMPHIQSGAIKALGVTTADRAAAAPDIPTVGETVPGFDSGAWFGIVVPKGTPPEAIERLNEAVNAALNSEEVKKRYAELGAEPIGGEPADLQKQIESELAKWGKVVEATGTRID